MAEVRKSSWFTVKGEVLVSLGIAALLVSTAPGSVVQLAEGWILALSGFLCGVAIVAPRGQAHQFLGLLSAIIAVIAGLLLLALPKEFPAVWVVAGYLLLHGIIMMRLVWDHPQRKPGWRLIEFSGILDCVLAAVLVLVGPNLIGLVVGTNLLVTALALFVLENPRWAKI